MFEVGDNLFRVVERGVQVGLDPSGNRQQVQQVLPAGFMCKSTNHCNCIATSPMQSPDMLDNDVSAKVLKALHPLKP